LPFKRDSCDELFQPVDIVGYFVSRLGATGNALANQKSCKKKLTLF